MNENEKFYKNICQKYIDTMSKEMLFESNKKILHIFIEDDYIELKEEGKINNQNYKKYLDRNFSVYEYDSYQELYDLVIKDEIVYDLNDLELFDENDNWNFYITFEELKKIGYSFMVKDEFPLIEKYILTEEEIYNFFKYFSLKQLKEFEKTLYLYYEIDDIDYNSKTMELESNSNSEFNSNIIYLSEGMIEYKDFMSDYSEYHVNYYDQSFEKVMKYFRENNIKDLMEYGSDRDEGLYHLTDMYEEIMNELEIDYLSVYTEDVSDGKYLTTIIFENNSSIKIDTNAWNGREVITENVVSICETYQKLKEKTEKKESKNEKEFDYDLN